MKTTNGSDKLTLNRHLIFIFFAMVLLLAGCAGSATKPVATEVEVSRPEWILNPEKPGYYSVVGAAPIQEVGGRTAQFRVAELKTRKELAQMIRVHIESTVQSTVEQRDGKITRQGDIEMKLQSSVELSLDAARIIEEWTDPKSGKLYIWLVTPK